MKPQKAPLQLKNNAEDKIRLQKRFTARLNQITKKDDRTFFLFLFYNRITVLVNLKNEVIYDRI